MFDHQTLLCRPSLQVVTAHGHPASTALSICLPAGRVDEDDSTHGAADVLAALLDAAELRDATQDVTALWSVDADEFALSCVLNCRPLYAESAIRDLANRWRRILAFDPCTETGLRLFHAARAEAAARQQGAAGTRRGIADTLVDAWARGLDGLPQSRADRTLALAPEAFRRYLTAAVAPRAFFAAHCGPEPERLAPALDRFAVSWPGADPTAQHAAHAPLTAPARAYLVPAAGPTAWITTAWPSVPRHDPRHRISAVLATLLSAGDGPLLTRLRHTGGHLYRIEARTVALITTGRLLVQGEVHTAAAQTCVRAVHHAVEEAGQGSLDPHMADAARRRLLTRIRHAVATNRGRAADLASAHLHGLPPDHHHEIEAGILAVPDEALHRFARELADTNAINIVIGSAQAAHDHAPANPRMPR